MSRLKRLISEVHRRSLWQVLLIYVGGAWFCYEIIDTIADRMALPTWLPVLAILLFLLGLPFVVATAFVRESEPAGTVTDPTLIPVDEARAEATRRHRFLTWRNAVASFVVALAVWGVVATVWMLSSDRLGKLLESRLPEPVVGSKSIAVLPFANMSAEVENEYFSDGITETIITHLSKIADLKVISRTSVMQYKNTEKHVRQIADELGVATVLEGSVQRAEDRVRITAQLIDARSDEHLWAEQYNREMTDVFAIQSDVAEKIASALQATLTPGERKRIQAAPTENLEAYDYYLHGRNYFHQRTPVGFTRAIEAYEKAIELDSAFAPAYAGLASAYGVSVTYDYRAVPDPYLAARRALAMADAAVALDPGQAEAYAARAYVLRYLWAPFDEVAADLRQALRLEPNTGDTHGWYGHLLARERRFHESMAEHEKAVELDPLALGRRVGFSWDALAGREYDSALREAERGLALAPNLADPQAAKAASLLMLGRPGDCAQLDLGPYEGIRAMCLHAEGRVAEASALVDSIRALIDSDSFPDSVFGSAIPAASIATYYAWVGQASESLAWFERAFSMSPETHFYRIFQSGLFDNVRDDAGFWAGVERLRKGLRARLSEES